MEVDLPAPVFPTMKTVSFPLTFSLALIAFSIFFFNYDKSIFLIG
jgi:hypothetical protein